MTLDPELVTCRRGVPTERTCVCGATYHSPAVHAVCECCSDHHREARVIDGQPVCQTCYVNCWHTPDPDDLDDGTYEKDVARYEAEWLSLIVPSETEDETT